jgi:hypothetical protein
VNKTKETSLISLKKIKKIRTLEKILFQTKPPWE